MEKAKKFFKDTAFYLSSNVLANVLNFVTGIVVRRLLAPALMGLYNGILLVFDYARYAHLGIIDAMDKELPLFYGKKDYQKLERIKDVGYSACLMVVMLISAGILTISFVVKFDNRLLATGIRIVAVMVMLRLMNSLYIVMNRSRNRFSIISRYTLLIAACGIALKVVLIINFGLYGLLWASVLTFAAGFIYFYKASGEKFKFLLHFSFNEILSLLKIGFPIFIMGFVFMTLRNIDRIMILRLLDTEALGFYTIALMVTVYMLQFPNLIYAVFFPRFYQAYGEKQDIHKIRDLFIKPTIVFAYLLPVIVGASILCLPLLLKYILPKYMPGFLSASILLLGSCFIGLTNMPQYLLIALNKQIYMVFIGIFAIAVAAGLNYILVKRFNFGLSGIAFGTSIAYFCYTTTLTICAYRNYTKRILSHLKFFAGLYIPFLWVLILLLIIQGFVFKTTDNFFEDFLVVFYKGLMFLLGCLPLILYANKKTAIFALIKNTYFKRTK